MSLLNTNLHKHRPHGLAKNTFENLNNAFLKINMQYIKVIQKRYCEKKHHCTNKSLPLFIQTHTRLFIEVKA